MYTESHTWGYEKKGTPNFTREIWEQIADTLWSKHSNFSYESSLKFNQVRGKSTQTQGNNLIYKI